MDINLYVLLLGVGIGVVSAFLGLGGGILIVPLLPLVTTLNQHEVIGTSLFTILLVVTNNTIQFHFKKLVVWRAALIMGPISAVFAYFFAGLGLVLPESVLVAILAAVCFLMSTWTMIKKQPKAEIVKLKLDHVVLVFLIFASAVAGALSGLLGIGSGMIVGAVLLNLRALPNAMLSPTNNAIMMFTCAAGAFVYMQGGMDEEAFTIGRVHLIEAILLFTGAFLSSQFARKYQHMLPAYIRKWFLGGLLLLLGIKSVLTLMWV